MTMDPMQPPQDGRFQVDVARAFNALQRNTADQLARMNGDLAAKDAGIEQLMEENRQLRQQIDMLNQRLAELTPPNGNAGPGPAPGVMADMGDGPVPSIRSAEQVGAPSVVMGPPPGGQP